MIEMLTGSLCTVFGVILGAWLTYRKRHDLPPVGGVWMDREVMEQGATDGEPIKESERETY